jgi:hypothetical protein
VATTVLAPALVPPSNPLLRGSEGANRFDLVEDPTFATSTVKVNPQNSPLRYALNVAPVTRQLLT